MPDACIGSAYGVHLCIPAEYVANQTRIRSVQCAVVKAP